MMGRKIEGHGDCLICHPDLDKRFAKYRYGKGLIHINANDRRKLQDDVNDLALDESIKDIDIADKITD